MTTKLSRRQRREKRQQNKVRAAALNRLQTPPEEPLRNLRFNIQNLRRRPIA